MTLPVATALEPVAFSAEATPVAAQAGKAVFLRKLLPIWADACASGMKFTEFNATAAPTVTSCLELPLARFLLLAEQGAHSSLTPWRLWRVRRW